jgi:hypothetical protein
MPRRDEAAEFYNLFSEWSQGELRDYLREHGDPAPAPTTPVELLRARCAEIAEADATRQRQAQAHCQSRQIVAPPSGPDNRKKAFICGINYLGTRQQLSGCINDARCMHYLLRHRLDFRDENILFMADDHPDPSRRPTKANMIAGMQWLVRDLQPGDSLVFHYSGHGSQQRDTTGTERDGMNETLVPLDSQYAGQIPDDMINQLLVRPLPSGVKLHAIIDSCHSGSMLDLPFMAPCVNGALHWVAQYAHPQIAASKGTSGGFAVQFSASADHEYAADTASLSGTGVPTGAATYSFIQAIERRGLSITYGQLVTEMYFTLQQAGLSQGGNGPSYDPFFGGLFSGGGSFRGQTPSISANYAFDFSFPLKF